MSVLWNSGSFDLAAFKATRADVFRRNGAVVMFYFNFLQIRVVLTRGLAVGMADQISGKFTLIANAAYS